MLTFRRFALALVLLAPVHVWATSWSSCQTITAVSNYLPHSDAVYLTLSPGISGCNSIVQGASGFRVGQAGVTADTIKSLLATSLAAYLAGKQVMIYYEEVTGSCYGMIISVGGYSGQCP